MRTGEGQGRTRRRAERGAALLVVMVAIAILTALAADLAYDNRVRLQIAANGRDALRAEGLAKSAVSLSRLVLAFQAQIDQTSQQVGALTEQLTNPGQGVPPDGTKPPGQVRPPNPQPAPSAQGGTGAPRPQIWNIVPVNSGLVQALFGGAGAGPDAGAPIAEGGAKATAAFGDFEGAFEAKLQDESTKVNLQLDQLAVNGALGMQVEAYLRLVCDPRWDALFDKEDANGQRTSRQDLAVYLHDWTDEDERASASAVSFPGGGNCAFLLPQNQNPFEQGFSDENYAYDRGSDRYRAKNSRFDSVDEVYLVAGVSDAFMAAFGDSVTVYLPKDSAMNVNSMRPEDLLLYAKIMVEPAAAGALADPLFLKRLQKAISDARMGGFLSIPPPQFASILEGLGVPVKPEAKAAQKNPFSDKSIAYRIQATGAVGDVEKRIDAVVTFDPSKQGDPSVANKPVPGRLIHWREE
jgi:general secretion pathway protein K